MDALMDIFNMQILPKNTLLAKRETHTTHRITVVKKTNKSKLGTMNSEFQSWACDHMLFYKLLHSLHFIWGSVHVWVGIYICVRQTT